MLNYASPNWDYILFQDIYSRRGFTVLENGWGEKLILEGSFSTFFTFVKGFRYVLGYIQ
jgi:hypothetical protein